MLRPLRHRINSSGKDDGGIPSAINGNTTTSRSMTGLSRTQGGFLFLFLGSLDKYSLKFSKFKPFIPLTLKVSLPGSVRGVCHFPAAATTRTQIGRLGSSTRVLSFSPLTTPSPHQLLFLSFLSQAPHSSQSLLSLLRSLRGRAGPQRLSLCLLILGWERREGRAPARWDHCCSHSA